MKTKLLLALVLVLLAFTASAWAGPADPGGNLIGTSNATASGGLDTLPALLPEPSTGDFSDAIPLITQDIGPRDATMHVELFAQEIVVGLQSIKGVGVMLTF